MEEALIEMYLAGVSVRWVEDITEALWGRKVSASTISELNKKAYVNIEAWCNRSLTGKYPYIYVDGRRIDVPIELRVRKISGLPIKQLSDEFVGDIFR